jgi:hypothetical protein
LPPPPSVLQPVDPNARYKRRRQEARQRRHKRRLVAAGALLALIAAGVVGALIATHIQGGGHKPVRAAARAKPEPKVLQPRPLPNEVRGVHVTMALASLPGKLDEYIRMKSKGLTTIELDVKDENGEIGWPVAVPLARKVGAAKPYYDAQRAAAKIHAAGLYLVGRIVTFEDPVLAHQRRPRLDEPVRPARLALQRRPRRGGGEGGLRRDPVRLRPLPQ